MELKSFESLSPQNPVIKNNSLYNYTEYLRINAVDAALSDNYKFGGAALSLTDFGSGTTIINKDRPDFSASAPSAATGKIKIQIEDVEYYIALTAV